MCFQAIGTLASQPPSASQVVSGLLVSKDFSYTLLDSADLRDFTGLETSTIVQRQKIALEVGWELIKWHLEGMFGEVVEGVDKDGKTPVLRVSLLRLGLVFVRRTLTRHRSLGLLR